MLSDQELLELNKQGFIPGPRESEEEFLKRIKECLTASAHLQDFLDANEEIPFTLSELAPSSCLQEAQEKIKNLFDISPAWVPTFYSDKKLARWHGGVAWLVENFNTKQKFFFLQLRKIFSQKRSYLKIYSKNEILSHELAHAGRMAFTEPLFEEALAYQTSARRLPRIFGPILQSSQELIVFLCSLFIPTLLDLAALLSPTIEGHPFLFWLKLTPLILLVSALLRLTFVHRTLSKCHSRLNSLLGSKALPVLYRLTDHEIPLFSKMTPLEIQNFAQAQKEKSLRWRLIFLAYF